MRFLRKSVTLATLAGLLGASLAFPVKADDWGWGRRHRDGDWDNRGAAAAAAAGGFALGAMAGAAAQQPRYGAVYGPACYFVDRPVTDDWGDVIEYRRSRVCDGGPADEAEPE